MAPNLGQGADSALVDGAVLSSLVQRFRRIKQQPAKLAPASDLGRLRRQPRDLSWLPDLIEQMPRAQGHAVQHRLGETAGVGVLLPQLNVSTPKRASREDGHKQRQRDDRRSRLGFLLAAWCQQATSTGEPTNSRWDALLQLGPNGRSAPRAAVRSVTLAVILGLSTSFRRRSLRVGGGFGGPTPDHRDRDGSEPGGDGDVGDGGVQSRRCAHGRNTAKMSDPRTGGGGHSPYERATRREASGPRPG
jgi:hypothetical protein